MLFLHYYYAIIFQMELTISQLKAKVVKAKDGIEQETLSIINKYAKEIVDLVREKQIFQEGINGSGNIFGVYNFTALKPFEHNEQRGYPKIKGSQVNLYDTGAFYKSFTTDYGDFELMIFATDAKSSELERKYGSDIFMLTEKNQDILSEKIIRPNLVKYFRKYFK